MNMQSSRTIALTFSGGGFRAAGFSLGTMVLLKQIGLLEKVQAFSSASGGSITAAFFLVSKANNYDENKKDWDFPTFLKEFYKPLKSFLESDRVANAILSDLGGEKKMIKQAAKCYQEELEKLIKNSESTLISQRIWTLLQDSNTSPDCLSINSTNMTDASLFRFATFRTEAGNQGVIMGNRFIDLSNNSLLSKCYEKLKLGDIIAASSCFPLGFEPIIYPDDFCDEESDRGCLRKVINNQQKLALMDAGLYDNLALASIESLRPSSHNPNQKQGITLPSPISLVIATDADNLEPSSALMNPDKLDKRNNPNAIFDQLGWYKFIINALDFFLKLFKIYYNSVYWLISKIGIQEVNSLTSHSWRLIDENKLVNFIQYRTGELSPLFGSFLKRNRNLTYQFLQYKYEHEPEPGHNINLVRNLIFDLYNRNDQDTALNELVPRLTGLTDKAGPSVPLKKMIEKINTLVLALRSSQNLASGDNPQIKTLKNEGSNIDNLICLAKLATALPTTLWLKWYTICSVETKAKKYQSRSLIKEILRDESVLTWKIDNKQKKSTETNNKNINTTELCMTFAANADDSLKTTAVEVVIACGFVAACYNILEYSANKIGVLYSNQPTSNKKIISLSQLNEKSNDSETLKIYGDEFRHELEELGLKEIEKAASIWWKIISISLPSSSSSGQELERKILHHFIKHIILIATEDIDQ